MHTYVDADERVDERDEYPYDGTGHGGGGGGEDGPAEWMTDAWETTMGWARTAGQKLVQAEEGVWRWVNART